MALYYAANAGSILAVNAWDTAQGGTGNTTFADGNAAGHTLDLNGKAMTSPTGTTLTCALLQATTGTLTPAGTLVINGSPSGAVTYNGTSIGGMVRAGDGASVQVNGQVTATNSGYALVSTGSGAVSVANAGSVAVYSSGGGRGVSSSGSGVSAIVGDVVGAGAGPALYILSGTTTLDGVPSLTNMNGQSCQVAGGTLIWTGSRTLGAVDSYIDLLGGSLNIASLVLTNHGRFSIRKRGGGITTGTGPTLASIANMTSAAMAIVVGGDYSHIIHGPTLPAAGDVDSTAAAYGYAGSPIPPTCLLPAEADVKSGTKYGADAAEFTGSLVGGGGGPVRRSPRLAGG